MKERKRSGLFITPGDQIAVIEEFVSGPGTYVEDGKIYSKVIGYTLLDSLKKEVSVYPVVESPKIPTVGSVVLGIVERVRNEGCDVNIVMIGGKKLTGTISGLLHISDVSPAYVDSMFDVCRPGDFIKAVVVSNKNRVFHLSTADRELGVTLSFCSKCGKPLTRENNRLFCKRCKNIERRKTAASYWNLS